jgi:hypothetical protein
MRAWSTIVASGPCQIVNTSTIKVGMVGHQDKWIASCNSHRIIIAWPNAHQRAG